MNEAEETALARAQHADQEWRVWLLPPRRQAIAASFVVGEPVANLPQPVALAAALPAGVSSLASVALTGDAALYPVGGMVAVASGGNVTWLRYTGKASGPWRFTGVTRSGYMGAMPAGSVVDVRYLISDQLTRVTIEERELYGRLGQPWGYDWTARVEGTRFEANQFPPEATFLAEARFWEPLGGWTQWLLMARGYAAEGYGVSYDPATGERVWDGTIRSLSTYVERSIAPNHRYGAIELEGLGVSTSQALGQPMIVEPQEYEHQAGNAQPQNLVDRNPRTLWISANVPTRTPETGPLPPAQSQENALKIQSIGVVPAVGAQMLQWIELVAAVDPTSTDHYVVTIKHPTDPSKSTIFGPSGSADWPDEPIDRYIPVPGGIMLTPPPAGQLTLVLTNNAELFTQRFGVPYGPLVDWRDVNGDRAGLSVTLPTDTAGIMLRRRIAGVGVRGVDFVAYGHAGYPGDPQWFVGNDWSQGTLPHWGTGLATLDPGATLGGPGSAIRRKPALLDTQRVSDWTIEARPVPGDPAVVSDEAWAIIDVPEFVVETAAAMSAQSHPAGSALAVTDATPLDPTGWLILGNERIAYGVNAADPYGAVWIVQRDVDGAGDTTHAMGTRVYQYVQERNEATARESVGRISLVRPNYPTRPDGLPVRLRIGELWAGSDGATNSGTGWQSTWHGAAPRHSLAIPDSYRDGTIDLTLAGWPVDTAATRRVAKLLLRIFDMSDAGRAKLNEVRLWRSRSNGVANGEIGIGAVVRDLLERVLDAGEVEIAGAFAYFGEAINATILSGPLVGTLQTLCEEHLVTLRYTRDGRVRFAPAPHHPQTIPTPRYTLDGAAWRSQQVTRRSRLGLGSMLVTIEDATTGTSTSARYPLTEVDGQPQELILRSSAGVLLDPAVLARALYIGNQQRAHEMRVESAGLLPLLKAGDWIITEDYTSSATPQLGSWRVASIERASDGSASATLVEWRQYA